MLGTPPYARWPKTMLSCSAAPLRDRQRSGGSAATMESLGQQRRNIEDKLAANRC
jgi:hypothetical protein